MCFQVSSNYTLLASPLVAAIWGSKAPSDWPGRYNEYNLQFKQFSAIRKLRMWILR